MTSQQVPPSVIAALQRGDKMGAIKLLREASGGDLKSAMAMIQNLAVRVAEQQNGGSGDRSGDQSGNHSGPHHLGATAAQIASRAETISVMSKSHPPTVMPGDGATHQWVWLLIGVVALAAWVFFG